VLKKRIILIKHFLLLKSNLPKNLVSFVPKGYQVFIFTFGNLNFAIIKDVIMVLKSEKEDSAQDMDMPIKRRFLIIWAKKTKHLLKNLKTKI
jgi:hypothetical protein